MEVLQRTESVQERFKVGEKVTVEYLNQYVPEEYRAVKFSYKSNLLLKDAKEKYPEWYQKRIVEKKPKGTWYVRKIILLVDQEIKSWSATRS